MLRDGEAMPLPPKAKDVLRVLLERSGSVVEKEDLMSLVCPDAVVTTATAVAAMIRSCLMRRSIPAARLTD